MLAYEFALELPAHLGEDRLAGPASKANAAALQVADVSWPIYMYTRVHACIHACECACTYTCTHVHACACACAHERARVHDKALLF